MRWAPAPCTAQAFPFSTKSLLPKVALAPSLKRLLSSNASQPPSDLAVESIDPKEAQAAVAWI